MAEELRSNILIAGRTTGNLEGFRKIHTSLDSIKTKLEVLSGKEYEINLRIKGIDEIKKELAGLGALVDNKTAKQRARTTAAKASQQEGLRRPAGVIGASAKKVDVVSGKEGPELTHTSTDIINLRNVEKIRTITEKVIDGKKQIVKITAEENNLTDRAVQLEKKRSIQAEETRKARSATTASLRRMGDNARQMGFTAGTKTTTVDANTGQSGTSQKFWKTSRDAAGRLKAEILEVNTATNKYKKSVAEGTEAVRYLDGAQARVHKAEVSRINKILGLMDRKEAKVRAASAKALSTADLKARGRSAIESGFTAEPAKTTTDTLTGNVGESQRFFKSRRVGLAAWEVDIQKINTATNKFTTETLHGAAAAKFMGDSMASAAAKVALWTIATTAVFGMFRLIRQAADDMKELESNTVFLARVGKNLGSTWDEQIAGARTLTQDIIKMSAAIGGNATEAQRSAAVFLRAGQTRSQTLESVKASLLASKIAEIEVEDAANLLSSAYLQFNMSASDLLPTLDSLNTLSNTYRVTTDDLLQSISRAGSVISSHGGSLEELAGLTAVVAQETSRTGAQIGNAFKTIQSRMDRFDVRKNFFDKLGVSAVKFDGEAKGLLDTLLEMQFAMDRLTLSEKKEIEQQAGGIRQKNILIAALKNADAALIAHNRALTNEASSMVEFHSTTKTLSSALDRLQGSFTSLASSSSGMISTLAASMTEILIVITEVLNAGEGIPIQMVTVAAGIILAKNALILFAKSSWAASLGLAGLHTFTARLRAEYARLTMSTVAQTRAQMFMNSTAAAGKVAMLGLGTAIGTILSPTNLALIAGALLISQLGSIARAQTAYKEALEDEGIALEKSLSIHERRFKALQKTSGQIGLILNQLETLQAAGEADKFAEKLETLRKLAGSVNVKIEGEDLEAVALEAQNKLLEEQLTQKKKMDKANQVLLKQKKIELDTAKKEQWARQFFHDRRAHSVEKLKKDDQIIEDGGLLYEIDRFLTPTRNNRKELIRDAFDQIGLDPKSTDPMQDQIKEMFERYLAQTSSKVEEQKNVVDGLEIIINGLQEKVDRIKGPEETRGMQKRKNELHDERLAMRQKFDKREEMEGFFKRNLTRTETLDRISKITDESEKLKKNVEDTMKLTGESAEIFKEDEDRLEKMRKAISEIRKPQQERISTVKNFTANALKDLTEMKLKLGEIQVARENALSGAGGFNLPLRQNNQKRATLAASIKNDVEIFKEAMAQKNDPNVTLEERREISGRIQGVQVDMTKNLVDLKQLELSKVVSIAKAEADIAISRKNSADEALRALGALSDEDKLRVAAQSAFFTENPNAKITALDRFNASSESNSMLDRFWGTKGDPLSTNNKDPTVQDLLAKGFGQDRQTERAAVALEQMTGGESQASITNTALELTRRIAEMAGLAVGDQASTGLASSFNPGKVTQNSTGQINLAVPIQLNEGAFDMSPVVEAFVHVADIVVRDEIQRSEAAIMAVINANKLNADRVPVAPRD